MADQDSHADEITLGGLLEAGEFVGPDDLGELVEFIHGAIAELAIQHRRVQLDGFVVLPLEAFEQVRERPRVQFVLLGALDGLQLVIEVSNPFGDNFRILQGGEGFAKRRGGGENLQFLQPTGEQRPPTLGLDVFVGSLAERGLDHLGADTLEALPPIRLGRRLVFAQRLVAHALGSL